MTKQIDILIIGGGIAGLWLLHLLKRKGYDVLLLTDKGIGAGQTLASQGIIHSGLKYTIAGKVNELARAISRMPDRWREALNGAGDVDLSGATVNAQNQQLMIPPGIAGNLIKIATEKTFGDSVQSGTSPHPGFEGSVLDMGEMVLDIPSVVRALAEPYRDYIREGSPYDIDAKLTLYTAAKTNLIAAKANNDDEGLKTQHRPLINIFVKEAPFPLYAHFVGASDKPVATITTHKMEDGSLCWYLGGQVAERDKDSNPADAYQFAVKAFEKYLPGLDVSGFEWAALPIDRVEGKSRKENWMPDTPTIHDAGDTLYCWPTKLTFAPMLGDMVMEKIDFEASKTQSDFSQFKKAEYAKAPWDEMEWIKLH